MRWLILSLVLLFGIAQSQEIKATDERTADQRGTEKQSLVIKALEAAKTAERIEQERPENEKKADRETRLVIWTVVLAVATIFLMLIAGGQLWMFWRQLRLMRDAVIDGAKVASAARDSADASLKSNMPILFPYVTDMAGLHPLQPSEKPITYKARLLIAFDNYGKTPGIIKRVRAQLFLCREKDGLPTVEFEKLKSHNYHVIVPGDTRGKDTVTGALDMVQSITFNPSELDELLSEAAANENYRRFTLIGDVIYDDFLGMRHTSHFCVWLRLWTAPNFPGHINMFQVAHGEGKYGMVTHEKIPENDPLEAAP